MASLLKHHGLDLAVFDGERPLIKATGHGVKQAILLGEITIVRHCRLVINNYNVRYGLAEVLGFVDDEFQRLYELHGLKTSPYTWGLYPTQYLLAQNLRHAKPQVGEMPHGINWEHDLLPHGMLLAAEVVIIDPVAPAPHSELIRVAEAVDAYNSAATPPSSGVDTSRHLTDMASFQAKYGQQLGLASTDNSDRTSYVVDIDPKIAL